MPSISDVARRKTSTHAIRSVLQMYRGDHLSPAATQRFAMYSARLGGLAASGKGRYPEATIRPSAKARRWSPGKNQMRGTPTRQAAAEKHGLDLNKGNTATCCPLRNSEEGPSLLVSVSLTMRDTGDHLQRRCHCVADSTSCSGAINAAQYDLAFRTWVQSGTMGPAA
ncbi:hypothetical protein BV20DRAFT_424091 [Pilatotrama ljubarskyi]|nr:hypothetical protein BV20DRAFT_424091 [Pilatotrama ljubarskyi]